MRSSTWWQAQPGPVPALPSADRCSSLPSRLEFLMLKTELVMSMDGTRIAFDRLRPHLASHFSVYAYDRRGRGDSGDAGEYEPDREVEDLGALIDLIAEPVRLYGYSSGALLALRAAACGLPIAKMALLEPPLQ